MEDIQQAANLILAGELVAFPTETVYGLGALGLDKKAIQKVYNAKERPAYNPLIMHVSSLDLAFPLLLGEGDFASAKSGEGLFWQFAQKYWPGPLTLVGYKASHVPALATGGLDKVAVRIPAHPVALKLLELVGQPVVAPSANASGRPSSTTAEHVLLTLEAKIAAVLDGGPCDYGIESTVVDITQNPPVILRRGALELPELDFYQAAGIEGSPGRLDKHYAPLINEIRWASLEEMKHAPEGTGLLTLTLPSPASGRGISLPSDPAGYAKGLFAVFYQFEQAGIKRLWIEPLPQDQSWDSVRDRIQRALTAF